jgi:hypothetical protein
MKTVCDTPLFFPSLLPHRLYFFFQGGDAALGPCLCGGWNYARNIWDGIIWICVIDIMFWRRLQMGVRHDRSETGEVE